MAELLEEYLKDIHYYLRVTTNIGNLLCVIEEYSGGTAKYAKWKGYMIMDYKCRYHPTAYLYPVSWSCGGLRQDIGVEDAVAVLMNIPHYPELPIWRMSCGDDGILEENLYIILWSVEMVSLLRVLYILHISLCLTLRWFARNCGDIEKYGFGVSDMPKALDLMDKTSTEITKDVNFMLDDVFMTKTFEPLSNKINPFKEYLTYIF